MKVSLSAGFVLAVLASACTGGGGGGGPGYLTPGNYLVSNAAVTDGCNVGFTPADYNGNILSVSTTGAATVTIDGTDFARSGNAFALTLNGPQQVGTDCTVSVNDVSTGSIHPNAFNFSESFTATNPVGTTCATDIPTTLPCTEKVSYFAALQ